MRHPKAHGDRNQLIACAEAGNLHHRAYAFRNVQRRVQCCLDQHDNKLLPAVARHMIDIAHGPSENCSDIRQYLVTRDVTIVIVD